MTEKVSYMVVLKDMLSSPLNKLSNKGNTAYNKLITKQRTYNQVVNTGSANLGSFSSSILNLKNLLLGYVGLNLGRNMLRWGTDMEQARLAFQTLLQDVEKGNELFKNVNLFANVTPYTNQSLIKGTKTLLSFGVAGSQVMGTLDMLGNVAAGNQQRMENLTLAYAQTQAAGKLMGQDLLQYVNAGFNPLKVISEKTGKSLMELREEMQKGAISSEMVSWAFQQATSEGGMFYNMMNKQSKTIGGRWSTLMGTISYKLGQFIESNNKFFISIINGLINSFNWIIENKGVLVSFFGILTAGFGVYKLWVMWTKRVAIWQAIVAATNPFMLIVAGIAALVAGIVYAWNHFEGFRKVILGTWEVIKGFADMIKNYVVTRIKEFLQGITGLADAIGYLFQGEFKKAAEAGVKAVGNLFGVESKKQAWEAGLKLGDAYNKGASKALNFGKKKQEDGKTTFENMFSFKPGGGSGGDETIKTSSIEGSLTGSGTGGRGAKNISISISSLIEKFEIHTTNLSESVDDIERKISEVLLQVVNDANLAAG